MAIHVRIRNSAQRRIRKKQRIVRLRSLLLSILIWLLTAAALYLTRELILARSAPAFSYYRGEDTSDELQWKEEKVDKTTGASGGSSSEITPEIPLITADTIAPIASVMVEEQNLGADIGTGSNNGDVPGLGDTFGSGIGLGSGDGSGVGFGEGDGDGGGGGGLGSTAKTSSCLVGTLYDLKKLKNGRDSEFKDDIENLEVHRFLSNFYRRHWIQNNLNKFYKAPINLYATCFYMPNCLDSEAPHAYQCADTMKPSRWVAVYRGRVCAPKSGNFRFWGIGDTTLAVRFNKRNVLGCGFHSLEKGTWNTHRMECFEEEREIISYDEMGYWNRLFARYSPESLFFLPDTIYKFKHEVSCARVIGHETRVIKTPVPAGGFLDPGGQRKVIGTRTTKIKLPKFGPSTCKKTQEERECLCEALYALRFDLMNSAPLNGGLEAGDVFKVTQGKWYDIEIMISEIGGGNFGFCLLLEDLGDGFQRYDSKKRPLFQLFRTAYVAPDPKQFYSSLKFTIPEEERTFPPYDPDSMIWRAEPVAD